MEFIDRGYDNLVDNLRCLARMFGVRPSRRKRSYSVLNISDSVPELDSG